VLRKKFAIAFLRHSRLNTIVIILTVQVFTLHGGVQQGIDQHLFSRKSISCEITPPQSLLE